MADNITIPGVGEIVAADDVGSAKYQRIKVAIGADGSATDWPSDQGAAGATVPRVVVANTTFSASSNFNRPANTTAYAANDAVSNNATAGSVTPLSFTVSAGAGIIRRIRVRKSDQTVATPTIRVWLYEASPTVAGGDNAAFSTTLADSIGYADVDVIHTGTDDAVGHANCDLPVAAGTTYALLQTLSVYTPSNAETYTVTVWGLSG